MLECFADAAPENSQVTFILNKVRTFPARLTRNRPGLARPLSSPRWPHLQRCYLNRMPQRAQVPDDPSPPSRVGAVRFNYVQSDHPTCLKALMVSAPPRPTPLPPKHHSSSVRMGA